MYTIDTVQAWLDEIAEKLPPELYNNLNGGILLIPDYKLSEHSKKDDLFILGEYFHDRFLGRMIYIYYGSFIHLFGRQPEHLFKNQLKKTLYHEFIHHLESLAGDRSLTKKDMEKLQRYLES